MNFQYQAIPQTLLTSCIEILPCLMLRGSILAWEDPLKTPKILCALKIIPTQTLILQLNQITSGEWNLSQFCPLKNVDTHMTLCRVFKGKGAQWATQLFYCHLSKRTRQFSARRIFFHISVSAIGHDCGFYFQSPFSVLYTMSHLWGIHVTDFINCFFLPCRKHPVSIRKNIAVYTNIGFSTPG